MDLAKAYNSVVQGKLFEALVAKLGVPADLVRALVLLYTDVMQQIVVDGELLAPFGVDRSMH